MSLKFYR